MRAALRRLLFWRSRRAEALQAPLNDRLTLWSGSRKQRGAVRARRRLGGHHVAVLEVEQDSGSAGSLDELLDDLLPRLDERGQMDLFAMVQDATLADLDRPGGAVLARSLRRLRDRTRVPLPPLPDPPDFSQRFNVDRIAAIDERSFWVMGWAVDEEGSLDHLELVSPEGQRTQLLAGAYRFPRPDVQAVLAEQGIRTAAEHGFVKYFELPAPSALSRGWLAELRIGGGGFEVPVPDVIRDLALARQTVILTVPVERPDVDDMRAQHAMPALSRLHARLRSSIEVEEEIEHGHVPTAPDVSIVVPLYGRIDLVEHQIAHFWADPDFGRAELLFVLDSPDLTTELKHTTALLHDLYGIPFKTVHLNRNGGYPVANNIGASIARGRLLLLLNSDVIPDRRGWLSELCRFHDATPDIGALGPKLLYEDDSIQHAGMYFQWDSRTNAWQNQHYFKGFSRALPGAAVSRPVPAVTGACLMLERTLFEHVGGFDERYVQGGYEDSDLSLRLIEAGRQNWYHAGVELYHLEAQSLPVEIRPANRHNAWLQTHLFGDRIAQVMRSQPDLPDAALASVPVLD